MPELSTYLFHLYESKWRFASLPDLMNIVRASSVLAVSLLVVDYFLVSPNVLGQFFFGKITIALYWILQIMLLSGSRMAYRYFRYTRTRQHSRAPGSNPLWCSAVPPTPKCCCARSRAAPSSIPGRPASCRSSPADRGQSIRGIPVLGGFADARGRRQRSVRNAARTITRVIFTPSAFEPDAKPEATLMRARRLGLTVSRLPSLDDGGEMPRLAPVNVEDLLLRPTVKIDYARLESFLKGRSIVVTGGGGSIGAEICDRVITFGAERLLIIENSEPALHAVLETLATKRTQTGDQTGASPMFAIAPACSG